MARCRPDRIVSENFDSHPASGKVNMLDPGKLRPEHPEDRIGRITPLGEGPLPDFPGDDEPVTQYCAGCAAAAALLARLKSFLLSLPEATIPRATFVQMTYSDCKRNQVLCEEAKKLAKEIEDLRL